MSAHKTRTFTAASTPDWKPAPGDSAREYANIRFTDGAQEYGATVYRHLETGDLKHSECFGFPRKRPRGEQLTSIIRGILAGQAVEA